MMKKSFTVLLMSASFFIITFSLSFSCAGPSAPSWEKVKDAPDSAIGKAYLAGFLNEKFGISAGYGGETHFTEDGGKTWPNANNKCGCRFGLEIVNEQMSITFGNKGDVRKSIDGGKTWMALTNVGASEPHQSRYVSFFDPATGWAASDEALFSTMDGGKTWQKIELSKEQSKIIALDLFAKGNGVIINEKGELYSTADNGKTWNKSAAKLEVNEINAGGYPLVAMRFTDPQTGLIIAYQVKSKYWMSYSIQKGEIAEEEPITNEMSSISSVFMNRNCSLITLKDDSNKIAVYKKIANKS
jgi:hypothetical protein